MSHLRGFIAEADEVRKFFKGSPSKTVNSTTARERVQTLVDTYFKDIRPQIAPDEDQVEGLRQLDADMQGLLMLSHGRSICGKYQRSLKAIRAALVGLDTALTSTQALPDSPISGVDERIISTLQGLLPSAACSYAQAVQDLNAESRLSWRGPATDLREALRETLDHLAPDAEVTSTPGFKLEPEAKGPTMRQKARHILKSRGSSKTSISAPEAAIDAIESVMGSFVRSVYTRSNLSTHTPTDKTEVLRVRDLVRVTLCELLEIRG